MEIGTSLSIYDFNGLQITLVFAQRRECLGSPYSVADIVADAPSVLVTPRENVLDKCESEGMVWVQTCGSDSGLNIGASNTVDRSCKFVVAVIRWLTLTALPFPIETDESQSKSR